MHVSRYQGEPVDQGGGSQESVGGKTEEEALVNLREALELYFEEPRPTHLPRVVQVGRMGDEELKHWW